ncbi:phage DNA packaging protein J [Streptomyces sp. NPDC088755]|uniref:phage DNA packaging protein J n=1 Tax=Streptomyces sp. NPDC088755 TaxID=3365888 RepID=UPI003822295A
MRGSGAPPARRRRCTSATAPGPRRAPVAAPPPCRGVARPGRPQPLPHTRGGSASCDRLHFDGASVERASEMNPNKQRTQTRETL